MKCVILAAGYATRLYPLTLNFPKALLRVGNKPIIGHIIDSLNLLEGIEDIYVVCNQKFFENFLNWQKTTKSKINIEVINDGTSTNETRLGAIGDLDFVVKGKKISEDLLIVAGDNLFDFDLGAFFKFAKSKKPSASVALYDIKKLEDAKKYGVVIIDKSEKIILFEEKPAEPKSTLIGTGIYFLPADATGKISEYFLSVKNKNDAIGNFFKWFSENLGLYGLVFPGNWYDIGDMEVYSKVKEKYKNK